MIKFITLIRLFPREDGRLVDIREEYTLEQLGGEIPNVGDTILSPWMSNVEEDLHVPSQRTFYEVVRRYLLPANPRDPNKEPDQEVVIRVALEVRERPGKQDEIELLP